MKRKRGIIWQNIDLDIKDFNDYFYEEGMEHAPDDVKLDEIINLNWDYLEDERYNLNIPLNNPVIAIADLGLWNGRKQGYKIFTNNLNEILFSDCDYCKWYSDGYNIRLDAIHHDGTNHILYREIKNINNIDNFTSKIYNNETITNKILNYYTRSILPYFKDIYGW